MRSTLTRRKFLLGGSALSLLGCSSAPARKPNIVLILADDLGASDLGCYGSTFHETPNIDGLAAGGMKFTNAYAACPVCSPTRAAIMTGQYPVRFGLTAHIARVNRFRHTRVTPVENARQLPLNAVTIAETLKGAGYETAAIGKWHLGDEGFGPKDQGFDLYVARDEKRDGFTTDRLTDAAVKFIREKKDRPFFLYFAHHDPHIPLIAKPEQVEKYKAKAKADAPQNNPLYAGMIETLDDSVGRVMQELEAQELAGNTLVIFTSDNGGLTVPEWQCQVPTSNAPFRSGKGHLYEGGIRVPLIVRRPGTVQAGATCEVPVISTDFYPTLTEAAQLTSDPGSPADGVSLVPLLEQKRGIARDALYWHYPHYSNQTGRPSGAIRLGNWKLIEFYEDGRLELYDLALDQSEANNLADQMPAKAKELHGMLSAWREKAGAKMPQPNRDYHKAREFEAVPWTSACR